MTDNEIIKALECCRDCNCKECPCCRIIDGGTHCTEIDEEQILDLINRLKAENEALINGQETLQKYISEKNAEVEKLTKENEQFADIGKMYSEIKSEAIIEFAERFWIECGKIMGTDILYWIKEIKNDLVKEMTEKE